MNAFDLPPGYTWSWDDKILEQGEENQQMGINFLLALVLVYLAMASLFESMAQPFAILFSIPFALPGAAWLLAATRTPFNIMAQIGLLMLIGIVVKNGIVLLDHMNQLRRAGLGRDDAILQAGRDRLRAVLMTALTAIVGLIPLALGRSTLGGDVYYYPLARTVIGGLASSTLLTLSVLPCINLGVEAAARWVRDPWRASDPPALRSAARSRGSIRPSAQATATSGTRMRARIVSGPRSISSKRSRSASSAFGTTSRRAWRRSLWRASFLSFSSSSAFCLAKKASSRDRASGFGGWRSMAAPVDRSPRCGGALLPFSSSRAAAAPGGASSAPSGSAP